MKHTAYHRGVVTALRRDYGVSARVESGGNHPALVFTYRGKPQRVTLHNDGSETNVLAIKLQDLRRTLGPPLVKGKRPKRTMEDLMDELAREARLRGHDASAVTPLNGATAELPQEGSSLPTEPAEVSEQAQGAVSGTPESVPETFQARVGLAHPNTARQPRLKFIISRELHDRFDWHAAVKVTMPAPDFFQLAARPGFKSPAWRLCANKEEYELTCEGPVKPGEQLYRPSPAEARLVDGVLIIQIIKKLPMRGSKEVPQQPKAIPEPTHIPAPSVAATRDDAAICLAEIRRIETTTEFRLTKLRDEQGQRWVFQARVE